MRLLNTSTLELQSFMDHDVPAYAILSHTWEEEEVTYQDMQGQRTKEIESKKGFQKVQSFCMLAEAYGFTHGWVDTCCIDKTSSSELSEAINSMFKWYQQAETCYAYLSDYPAGFGMNLAALRQCRWFTRGWCLQELIAPKSVIFHDTEWNELGTKEDHVEYIYNITGITRSLLRGTPPHHFSHAERMRWASNRTTTRVEDIAYCLLGIFGVNMTLLYGEGERAFLRLQAAIMSQSADDSLFIWDRTLCEPHHRYDLISNSPAYFTYTNVGYTSGVAEIGSPVQCTLTDVGIYLQLSLSDAAKLKEFGMKSNNDFDFAILRCEESTNSDSRYSRKFALLLSRSESNKIRNVMGVRPCHNAFSRHETWLYVAQRSYSWNWPHQASLYNSVCVHLGDLTNISATGATNGIIEGSKVFIEVDGDWNSLGMRNPGDITFRDAKQNFYVLSLRDCPVGPQGPSLTMSWKQATKGKKTISEVSPSWSEAQALANAEARMVIYDYILGGKRRLRAEVSREVLYTNPVTVRMNVWLSEQGLY